METQDLQHLVEDLTTNIDDLEVALTPILKTALSASTSKLPLLDKAKLYVLATYAIESILFSALRLNGVDAKNHPVFQELSRVKEYFAKIKSTENAGAKRSTVVDKEAAGRFVRAGLAGNERSDRDRKERRAGEKRKFEDAQLATGTHTRFDEKDGGHAKKVKVVRAQDVGGSEDEKEEVVHQKAAQKARREQSRWAKLGAAGEGEAMEVDDKTTERKADDYDADAAAAAPVDTGTNSQTPGSNTALLQELVGRDPSPPQPGGKKKKKKRGHKNSMRNLEDKRAEEML